MTSIMLGIASIVIVVSGLADKPYRAVYIRDCAGQFIPVYSDSRATQPMPNPIIAGTRGEFTFYTDRECVQVRSTARDDWQTIRSETVYRYSGDNKVDKSRQ